MSLIGRLLLAIPIGIMFFLFFLIVYYGVYVVALSDDVEVYVGKKSLRNRRRKYKGFWKKFLFLDFRKDVVCWHYVLFVIFLITYPIMTAILLVGFAFDLHALRIPFLAVGALCFISTVIASNIRWRLYLWNEVRRRPKKIKRKK
ncbi:MAG: hypothetical protein LBM28_05075 [Oscillospiraceae bacterium]|nr:hypothetical protein [Oscillospiraceae bacterium]